MKPICIWFRNDVRIDHKIWCEITPVNASCNSALITPLGFTSAYAREVVRVHNAMMLMKNSHVDEFGAAFVIQGFVGKLMNTLTYITANANWSSSHETFAAVVRDAFRCLLYVHLSISFDRDNKCEWRIALAKCCYQHYNDVSWFMRQLLWKIKKLTGPWFAQAPCNLWCILKEWEVLSALHDLPDQQRGKTKRMS